MSTTTAKERPILFSGPMVRAILEGRKTQTRRVVNPQPYQVPDGWAWDKIGGLLINRAGTTYHSKAEGSCPHGRRGDRLWVRETWTVEKLEGQPKGKELLVIYRASCESGELEVPGVGSCKVKRWKPSLFMRRWASRILLELSKVRIGRLQEITTEDAIAEGAGQEAYAARYDEERGEGRQKLHALAQHHGEPIAAFAHLWDGLNEPRGYAWKTNPWVWALDFRRVAA